jgi:hypothetical protein
VSRPGEAEPVLRDPNWYRMKYALAAQCLQIETEKAQSGRDEPPQAAGDEAPEGTAPSLGNGGTVQQKHGPALDALLTDLGRDEQSIESPLTRAIGVAAEEAEELLLTTANVLDQAGWHWVGRKPPRYLYWLKRRSARWVRGRPVASDRG